MSTPQQFVTSMFLFPSFFQSNPILAVVSAPLWNSEKSEFAGMLTVLDLIHLIQYYYRTASYDFAATDVETLRLEALRGANPNISSLIHPELIQLSGIEKELGVAPPPLLRQHPMSSLYDAAQVLIQTHAGRLPLLDNDTETGHETIVSTLTQYRLLKFISINVSHNVMQQTSAAHRYVISATRRSSTCISHFVSLG